MIDRLFEPYITAQYAYHIKSCVTKLLERAREKQLKSANEKIVPSIVFKLHFRMNLVWYRHTFFIVYTSFESLQHVNN